MNEPRVGTDGDAPLQRTLAALPAVDEVLRAGDAEPARLRYGPTALTTAVRAAIADARDGVRHGAQAPSVAEVLRRAIDRLEERERHQLRPVLNATGVILHTNLGRAPLSDPARDAVALATGYTTLEYDLATGARGSRTRYLGELAAQVCGTAAATVVNNGAAALLLVLAALAEGGEAIISRGELIEIGGSFRLPDVMELAGATMVEVGTTNRTHVRDYRDALTDATRLLVRVHPSNFRMVGFTHRPTVDELAAVARAAGVPLVYDLGGGAMTPSAFTRRCNEPTVAEAVEAGADLVMFSGDKLLGGPQAGIIAGRRDLVERCARHPLFRAVRVDKLQRAALEATLLEHLRGDAEATIPVLRMLATPLEQLRRRASLLAERLGAELEGVEATELDAAVGGGTAPEAHLPSAGLRLRHDEPSRAAARLRAETPPVVVRIADQALLVDLRTVPPEHDGLLFESLRRLVP